LGPSSILVVVSGWSGITDTEHSGPHQKREGLFFQLRLKER